MRNPKAGQAGQPPWLRLCSRVILLDLWFNAQVEAQAVDRVHRMNQPEQVRVFRIMAKKTLDDNILAVQRKKLGEAAFALDLAESPTVRLKQGTRDSSLIKKVVSDLAALIDANSARMQRVLTGGSGVWGDRAVVRSPARAVISRGGGQHPKVIDLVDTDSDDSTDSD